MREAPYQVGPYGDRPVRYEFVEADDPDEQKLRAEVQERAAGLYIVWCPIRRCKVLIEAEPPEGIGPDWLLQACTDWMLEDYRLGRLVAVDELALIREPRRPPHPAADLERDGLGRIRGYGYPARTGILEAPLDDRLCYRLRRGNRNARRHLRRTSSAHARAVELRNYKQAQRERAEVEIHEFARAYAEDVTAQKSIHSYGGV